MLVENLVPLSVPIFANPEGLAKDLLSNLSYFGDFGFSLKVFQTDKRMIST